MLISYMVQITGIRFLCADKEELVLLYRCLGFPVTLLSLINQLFTLMHSEQPF